MKGVKFEITKSTGEKLGTYETGEDGIVTINNLYPETLKIKEIETQNGYILDTKEYSAVLEWGKTTTIQIGNQYKKGSIEIIKVDKDDNNVFLEGVEFKLLDEKGTVLDTKVTDKNGRIIFLNLNIGDYTVRETKTKVEYNLAVITDTKVTVEWNQQKKIIIENEKKKGQVRVIKVDLDNNEIRIPNVKFEIYNKAGNLVGTIVTDKNGEAISSKLPINDEYTIKEVSTDEKYVLNSTPKTIVLEENKIKDIVFTNEKKKGQIEVYKFSEDENKHINIPANSPIPETQFELYDETGKLLETLTTDENRICYFKYLSIRKIHH